jgi:hypothetical protein
LIDDRKDVRMSFSADGLFKWTEGGSDPYRLTQLFDCAVAAVQDRFNTVPVRRYSNGPDFACAGEGVMGPALQGLGAPRWEELHLDVDMVFSDRVDARSGQTGKSERWTIKINRSSELSLTVASWNYFDLPLEDVTYTDKGGGNFITGYVRAPRGWWHIAVSLDRMDLDRL